ncbi:MAG: hypothetical protein KC636_19410, partial [Myxococcales bacterium]|nr:hypothetical protein [Myxococcales bacterium]
MALRVHVVGSLSVLLGGALVVGCGDSGRESGSSTASGSSGGSLTLTTSGSDAGTEGTEGSSASGSGSDSDGSTSGNTTESTTSSGSSATSGLKFDLAGTPDIELGCGDSGGGDIDESFIWIPTTSAGTVSKIDTRTLVEVARYNTGPSGETESVSRTAVAGDGRFVVVNSRGTGRSTAVAANVADCVDQNNDGFITTSQSAADVLPWG